MLFYLVRIISESFSLLKTRDIMWLNLNLHLHILFVVVHQVLFYVVLFSENNFRVI